MITCKECKYYDNIDERTGSCRGNIVPADRSSVNCPQKSFQRKLVNWLISPYKELFDNLKKEVKKYFEYKVDQELFTLHDVSHCSNVEKMIKAIVAKGVIDFSTLERFLLSCAAWTHDLGMNNDIAKQYFSDMTDTGNISENLKNRRREHHNISCWFIQKNCKTYFGSELTDNEYTIAMSRAISIIIQYHRKVEDLNKCIEFISIKGEIVRIKLLAAILRLADTLHKDASRFDSSMYAMLQIASFDRISRLHWIKSFVVSNNHLNETEQTITIQLSLPDYNQYDTIRGGKDAFLKEKEERDWDDRVRNLKYIISTDIEEDLVVVNSVFSKYGMPTYVNVNVDVSYIRGYDKEYYTEINGVLSELDILFSPNTSEVIKRTLDSLKVLSETTSIDKIFVSQFDQLKGYLQEIYSDRPCHVGLGKILSLLDTLDPKNDKKAIQKKFVRLLAEIDKYRQAAINKLVDKVDEIVPYSVRNIFLIGFSSTILKLLEAIARKRSQERRNINIYILECATKRRLGHSNLIEYNDGIHYATEIGKLDFYKITILPDLGFATYLDLESVNFKKELKDKNKDKLGSVDEYFKNEYLLLFGANGIDQATGDCGHTSGHLAVAIVANNFHIPVKVISDSFKVGKINWNPSARRKGDWLVTQKKYIEELSSVHVKIENLREDRIPVDLITEIQTENCCVSTSSTNWNKDFKKIVNESKKYLKDLERIVKG